MNNKTKAPNRLVTETDKIEQARWPATNMPVWPNDDTDENKIVRNVSGIAFAEKVTKNQP